MICPTSIPHPVRITTTKWTPHVVAITSTKWRQSRLAKGIAIFKIATCLQSGYLADSKG
jgi:hypothetical protein